MFSTHKHFTYSMFMLPIHLSNLTQKSYLTIDVNYEKRSLFVFFFLLSLFLLLIEHNFSYKFEKCNDNMKIEDVLCLCVSKNFIFMYFLNYYTRRNIKSVQNCALFVVTF